MDDVGGSKKMFWPCTVWRRGKAKDQPERVDVKNKKKISVRTIVGIKGWIGNIKETRNERHVKWLGDSLLLCLVGMHQGHPGGKEEI